MNPADLSDDALEKLIINGGAPASPAAAQPTPTTAAATAAPVANDATRSGLHALAGGVLDGMPIVGPAMLGGAQRAAALYDTAAHGGTYADNLTRLQGQDAADNAAHPRLATAGRVAGGVLGTVPAVALAPEAFGISSAGLGTNMLLGGMSGAAMGGADAGVRSGGDLEAMKKGAVSGGMFGAAGPAAGYALGGTVNRLLNAVSRTTPAARNVAGILDAAGITPEAARNTLLQGDPVATLADVNPLLAAHAGSLAGQGGAPTSILKTAMAARAAGADNRVATAIYHALGPKPDLDAALDMIQERGRQVAGPHYAAARAGAEPMDISHIVADLDGRIPEATGGVADTLRTLRGFLTRNTPLGTAIKDDPQQLLGARQAMDDLIERRGGADTTAGQNALRQARDIRGQLDQVLKENPDIAAGDEAFSSHMDLRDAMQDGVDVFKSMARPEAVRRMLQSMSPAEVEAYRQGARVAIGDALEQARRGELAGAQQMFGRASANRAKLDMLFPQAGDVFDMLQNEAAMRATEHSVAANSFTAERRAVQQKYLPQAVNPLSAAPAVIGEAMAGAPGALTLTAARSGYNALLSAYGAAARNRLIEGTARGLSATGPEQQAFLDKIARAARTNGGANRLSQGASAAANLLTRSAINPLLPQPSRR